MEASNVVAQAEQAAEQVVKKPSTGLLIGVAVFFIILVVGGLIFGLILMQRQKKNGGSTAAGEKDKQKDKTPDNDAITIRDSRRLLEKVEDIRDGIIITDGGARFVAAITCRGVGLYNESTEEQLSIMRGYQQFLNIANAPMTYRLYSRAVDIDSSKERYMKKFRDISNECGEIEKEIQIAKSKKASEEEVNFLQRELVRCQNCVNHLLEQMQLMEYYSDKDVVMDLTQDYIFDWEYKPSAIDAKLTSSEIFAKAKSELYAIADQKITALSAAGVKARICTNDEILDAIRRVSKPLTSEEYKQRVVSSSSFYEDIVSSDSIDSMEEAVINEETFRLQERFMAEDGSLLSSGGYDDNED